MDAKWTRTKKEHPLVLARGVNKMEFEFWDTRQNEWVDEWTQTNQLPKMMKFTLGFVVQAESIVTPRPDAARRFRASWRCPR